MGIDIRHLKDGCKIEDSNHFRSARINSQGYWCSFRDGASFYRRCMDGSIVLGAGARRLPASEMDRVLEAYQGWIKNIVADNKVIRASQQLTDKDYNDIADLYREVYPEEVTILPPDRYGDIVIMPATGCPNRRCTFCAFYKDKPYKVLNEQAFAQHLADVKKLYGAKVHSSPGVFLGSANAMALSQRRLMCCLTLIKEKLGTFKREIGTFADPDFSAKRTTAQWNALRESGLRHLVIGLETGWAELRANLGKSGDLDKCITMINSARRAGVNIGLTLLTGAAPWELRRENLKQTLITLESLELSGGDLIYLSPLSKNGFVDDTALEEQSEVEAALMTMTEAKVVPYQMQRFQYFM
ncbi:radical SAM protein [Salinisphaera sp. G21_0]|uniref:radical SAM protein n=1 Tax=Salinisphaera sp. G21_0 TaxID=2821094 RepID=UPI001ADA5563|nr:radical SAM protein [Salinisphaera sp. G21_0]MBO9482401.1 radical SAM protein [Salinisphaera sp. G21_0]